MTLVRELRLFYPKGLHQNLSGIKNWHVPFEMTQVFFFWCTRALDTTNLVLRLRCALSVHTPATEDK